MRVWFRDKQQCRRKRPSTRTPEWPVRNACFACWFSPNRFGTNWTVNCSHSAYSVYSPTSGGQDVGDTSSSGVRCQSLPLAGRSDSCVWATLRQPLHDPVKPWHHRPSVASVDDELENCPVPSPVNGLPRQKRMTVPAKIFRTSSIEASPRSPASLRARSRKPIISSTLTGSKAHLAPARLLLDLWMTARRRRINRPQ